MALHRNESARQKMPAAQTEQVSTAACGRDAHKNSRNLQTTQLTVELHKPLKYGQRATSVSFAKKKKGEMIQHYGTLWSGAGGQHLKFLETCQGTVLSVFKFRPLVTALERILQSEIRKL